MEHDLRSSDIYQEVARAYYELRRPGTSQICDAADLNVSPDGQVGVFAGMIVGKVEGVPETRICCTDLNTGRTRVVTLGPRNDKLPTFHPDGRTVAFLSDRDREGDFQLHLLDLDSGAVRTTPPVDGWVEYIIWSPDGKKILLGVAGHGADVAGGQGAVTSQRKSSDAPSWLPSVETGEESFRWRSAWIYDVDASSVAQVSVPGVNIWEASWLGNDRIAIVSSNGCREGDWYGATLNTIDLVDPRLRHIHQPRDQIGLPVGSPRGNLLAFVEAVCSDRGIVAGCLHLADVETGVVAAIDTANMDVTYADWQDNEHLLVAGHRGLETVIGLYDSRLEKFSQIWSSADLAVPGRHAAVAALPTVGDFAIIAEGFYRAPELALVKNRDYRTVKSFDLGYAQHASALKSADQIVWYAPDGLEIQGWLLQPTKGDAPYPLVLYIHGGPVWHWRPFWMARSLAVLQLLKRGYGVFLPNPRGSSGRGVEFARMVQGEMGGAETNDHLSGLDFLVEKGIARPDKIGVMGASHGGFMSSWLITQDTRFAAAVPIAPANNHTTQHLLSNIPDFVHLFVGGHFTDPESNYFKRSPIMYAHRAVTPTLNICGALDRCTPAEEATQFHNALLESGTRSVLVTYPNEGHGVRNLPAAIDYNARIISWFVEHFSGDGEA